MSPQSELPVAVIGGGPVGLAAAAHLVTRGLPVRLYEAGDTRRGECARLGPCPAVLAVGASTPTRRRNASCASHGWQAPPRRRAADRRRSATRPISSRWRRRPELRGVIETGARVRHVSRARHRQGRDAATAPIIRSRSTIEGAGGAARIDLARAVIDASGTWHNPNPLGAAGHAGDRRGGARATASPTAFPTCCGAERATYRGPARARDRRRTFGGECAARSRAARRDATRGMQLTWAVRSANLARVFGGGEADQLPARGKLGSDLKQLVESGRLHARDRLLAPSGSTRPTTARP